jgi:hypothetical protein
MITLDPPDKSHYNKYPDGGRIYPLSLRLPKGPDHPPDDEARLEKLRRSMVNP